MRPFRAIALTALCATSLLSTARRCAAQETPEPDVEHASSADAWRPGDPAPPGYRVQPSDAGLPFVILGGSIFVATYVTALGYGAISSLACTVESSTYGGDRCSPRAPGLMMIPFVGPLLYVHANDGQVGTTFYATDSILQVTGLALVVVGAAVFAISKPELVPETTSHKNALTKLNVLPMIGGVTNGVMLSGSF
jgi:hypothetical protein